MILFIILFAIGWVLTGFLTLFIISWRNGNEITWKEFSEFWIIPSLLGLITLIMCLIILTSDKIKTKRIRNKDFTLNPFKLLWRKTLGKINDDTIIFDFRKKKSNGK